MFFWRRRFIIIRCIYQTTKRTTVTVVVSLSSYFFCVFFSPTSFCSFRFFFFFSFFPLLFLDHFPGGSFSIFFFFFFFLFSIKREIEILRQILCTVMPNSDGCFHRFMPIRMIGSNSTTSKERTYPLYFFLLSLPRSYPYTTSAYLYKTISIDSARFHSGCVCVRVYTYTFFSFHFAPRNSRIVPWPNRGRRIDRSADKFIPIQSRIRFDNRALTLHDIV